MARGLKSQKEIKSEHYDVPASQTFKSHKRYKLVFNVHMDTNSEKSNQKIQEAPILPTGLKMTKSNTK